nr:serine/arginine repetitive matrix protein 2-like [Ipomoea batatas]
MSDSDSQNVSARDYDEGDEAVSESSSPSTGGSTFNQIDEVEHVSPIAEENKGPLQPTASTEDVSSSGRGKSPRPPQRGANSRLHTPEGRSSRAASPQAKPMPRSLVPTSCAPGPGRARSSSSRNACSPEPRPMKSTRYCGVAFLISFPKRTRALTDAAAKISSEVYDYLIFRTPEGYKNANLEPPDYGRDEKYEPVPIAAPAAQGSTAEPSQGMSPDRKFIAPAAAPRPKTKVALGAKKTAAKPTAKPPIADVPDPAPTDASSGGGAAPDLQVTLDPSWRGKEKRQEAEIEEVLTLKRTKRYGTRSPAWRPSWGGHAAGSLTHTTADLFSRARALEGIQEKEVVPLQKQVSAAERRIQDLEKELAAAEDQAEKAEKKLGEAEGRAERAKQAEKEAIDNMKDASSLARFICTDEAIAKEFLTAFINTEVGDRLTWVYGQWAFSSGCRAIQEQVHTALAEGLEESDLPVVMALLPDKVANPGPRPYSKPCPSE